MLTLGLIPLGAISQFRADKYTFTRWPEGMSEKARVRIEKAGQCLENEKDCRRNEGSVQSVGIIERLSGHISEELIHWLEKSHPTKGGSKTENNGQG